MPMPWKCLCWINNHAQVEIDFSLIFHVRLTIMHSQVVYAEFINEIIVVSAWSITDFLGYKSEDMILYMILPKCRISCIFYFFTNSRKISWNICSNTLCFWGTCSPNVPLKPSKSTCHIMLLSEPVWLFPNRRRQKLTHINWADFMTHFVPWVFMTSYVTRAWVRKWRRWGKSLYDIIYSVQLQNIRANTG